VNRNPARRGISMIMDAWYTQITGYWYWITWNLLSLPLAPSAQLVNENERIWHNMGTARTKISPKFLLKYRFISRYLDLFCNPYII